MAHEAKIHEAQTTILRHLLFMPSAHFAQLQKNTKLQSDHFKFHIARLVDTDYIVKNSTGEYSLTQKGKEYANKLDTDQNTIERQPKSAVIIVIADSDKVILQERLKHPYFGFWGYPGGKIRWGETIIEAASRELKEETGLTATMVYRGVYHEITRSAETNEILEDKIFHVVYGHSPKGTLLESFEGGHNAWILVQNIASLGKKYASTDIETSVGFGEKSFVEETQIYTAEEF